MKSGAPCHSFAALSKAVSFPGTNHVPNVTDKAALMSTSRQRPAYFSAKGGLTGKTSVPGDKSISHRALILSALAVGESRITGLLEGEDVLATAATLRAMGASIEKSGKSWIVHGVGVGGLMQPDHALDMGNSGTSTRLLMGLVSSHHVTATFTGDASLSGRPMGRVIDPLSQMGATIKARQTHDGKSCLPLTVRGLCPAVPLEYRLPVASAQVKSALLLAGLNTPGITRIIEPVPTRDHSETMLSAFGADLTVEQDASGDRIISLTGEAELQPQDIKVPGDPSSAAFLAVAALIVPGSDIIIQNVGINPTRAGLFEVLRQMGGDISFRNERTVGGEPVADLRVRYGQLEGIDVPAEIAPSMIDEFPILFVAAAMASGRTRTTGLHELRVKESDRLAQMAAGLEQVGAKVEETSDGLVIEGTGGQPLPGTGKTNKNAIKTALDHRIAMSFAVAGLASQKGVAIDDLSPVMTSFPGFEDLLNGLTGK